LGLSASPSPRYYNDPTNDFLSTHEVNTASALLLAQVRKKQSFDALSDLVYCSACGKTLPENLTKNVVGERDVVELKRGDISR
jgi:hypothetical protein